MSDSRWQHSEIGSSLSSRRTFPDSINEMNALVKHGMTLREQLETIRNEFNLLVNDFANIEPGTPTCSVVKNTLSTPSKRQDSSHKRIRMGISGVLETPPSTRPGRKMRLSQPLKSAANKYGRRYGDDTEDKENLCGLFLNQGPDMHRKDISNKLNGRKSDYYVSRKDSSVECKGRVVKQSDSALSLRHKHIYRSKRSLSKSIRCAAGQVSPSNSVVVKTTPCISSWSMSPNDNSAKRHGNQGSHFGLPISTPSMRSPGDGASGSPSPAPPSVSSRCDVTNAAVDLHKQRVTNNLMNSPKLPVADILLNRRKHREISKQHKASVLGAMSLRGLDGIDLSPRTGVVGDISNININDISKIRSDIKPCENTQLMMSLRERTSASQLVAGAMHSTLNYPLHSTMKNTMILPEPISGEDDDDDTWSTDSSEFSYDVDDSHTERPPRPPNPAVPCSCEDYERSVTFSQGGRRSCLKQKDMRSNFDNGGLKKEYCSHKRNTLYEVNSMQEGDTVCDQNDTIIQHDKYYSTTNDMDTTIIPSFHTRNQKSNKHHIVDLDKTVHTGCIALLKRQKIKTHKQKKSMARLNNNNNSDVAGCYGSSMPTNHNILLSSLKRVKSLSQSKRKHDQITRSPPKSERDHDQKNRKRRETSQECRKRLFIEARQ